MVDITDFRSIILRDGAVAKSQKFRIEISPDNNFLLGYTDFIRELPFLAAGSEHPGSGLVTSDIRYYGPSFKIPVKQQFNDITISFIVRGSMDVKNFFDSWKRYISSGGRGNYDFRFRNEYATKIKIFQTSELEGVDDTYMMVLNDAYPINVMPLQANWFEDSVHRLGVQFAYTDFESQQQG